jgi:hypothetical protein
MSTSRILLDSRTDFDAGLLGYDGPRDPDIRDEGLIVELHPDTGMVTIKTADSSIDLFSEPEIKQVRQWLSNLIPQPTAQTSPP